MATVTVHCSNGNELHLQAAEHAVSRPSHSYTVRPIPNKLPVTVPKQHAHVVCVEFRCAEEEVAGMTEKLVALGGVTVKH